MSILEQLNRLDGELSTRAAVPKPPPDSSARRLATRGASSRRVLRPQPTMTDMNSINNNASNNSYVSDENDSMMVKLLAPRSVTTAPTPINTAPYTDAVVEVRYTNATSEQLRHMRNDYSPTKVTRKQKQLMAFHSKKNAERQNAINRLSSAAASSSSRCAEHSDALLEHWQALYTFAEDKQRVTDNIVSAATFQWPFLMKHKREVLMMEGRDSKFGKLGVSPTVDMRRMKYRAEERYCYILIFSEGCNFLALGFARPACLISLNRSGLFSY